MRLLQGFLFLFFQPGHSYLGLLQSFYSRAKFLRRNNIASSTVLKKVTNPFPEPLPSRHNNNNTTDQFYAASILDDGSGHINRDLAESIYTWEQQRREKSHLPPFHFSARQGLRLVDEIARELLVEWGNEQRQNAEMEMENDDRSSRDSLIVDAAYSDLVQDGVVALMRAMAEYDGPSEQFEHNARNFLTQQLSRALAKQASPFRWPEQVVKTWRAAQLERGKFLLEMGREPSPSELAVRLNVTTQQLEVYQQLNREAVSMESTVEIYDPSLDDSARFADQDDWEHQEGLLLDHGDHVLSEELVEDLVDENMQFEGEDEMWVHHEQIAAPLRESIPDGEAHPDDIVLSEMFRLGVHDLVERTLDRKEKQIIRLRYGIGSSPAMSQREVANLWGAPINAVRRLEQRALRKLRGSYENRYIESHDESIEDSV